MDVKDLLESLDYSNENIHRQALVYSFSNILTLSMLTGFGIRYDLSNEFVEGLIERLNNETSKSSMLNNDEETKLSISEVNDPNDIEEQFTIGDNYNFVKNLIPIKAIYSSTKINPSIDDTINQDMDIGIDLDNKELNKELKPKNQGLLILNEVNLSKFLYNKSVIKKNKDATYPEKLISLILLDLAVNQAIFSHNHLRNSQGLFISKKDMSSSLDELDLKEVCSKIDWEDQVYMIWAYTMLHETLNNPKYERYTQSLESNHFKDYAFNLLSILEDHEYEIVSLDTASLSSLTSSLIEALKILDKEKLHLPFVVSLCDELCAREKQKGFMLSQRYLAEAASLASHFKSIEALTEGFQYTDIDLFLNTSEKIYNNLSTSWDDSLGLFKLDDNDNVKYSSKSISYVLKSLNKLSKVTDSLDVKKKINNQLTNFFDSSINDTGLQSSPPSLSNDLNMFRCSDTASSVIENMIDDDKSYVIEKGFEINNNKINKYSSDFSSEHALYASDAMLSLAIEES